MSTVVLDRDAASWLVAGALSHLWEVSPDAQPDGAEGEATGCCPRCCGPCSALKALLDAGQLDALAAVDGRRCFYWDTVEDRVDRAWLERAWTMTDCHAER